jgi:hypothetical protein
VREVRALLHLGRDPRGGAAVLIMTEDEYNRRWRQVGERWRDWTDAQRLQILRAAKIPTPEAWFGHEWATVPETFKRRIIELWETAP